MKDNLTNTTFLPENRRVAVATGIATFLEEDVEAMNQRFPEGMNRGLQFGVGWGKKPISHYPGVHTHFRPLSGPDRMPKISVDTLAANLSRVKGKIARASIKVESGTSKSTLLEVLAATRESLGKKAQIVIAATYPMLQMLQSGEADPDVWQESLDMLDPLKVQNTIRKHIRERHLIEGAEISFPFPQNYVAQPGVNSFAGLRNETMDVARILGEEGHNSHIGAIPSFWHANVTTDAIHQFNDQQSTAGKTPRLTGMYRDYRGEDIQTVPKANCVCSRR